MRGTQQIWNLVWQEGSYDNHSAPQEFGIDPRLGAATLRALVAILKFHRPSSLDYRARYGLPVKPYLYKGWV